MADGKEKRSSRRLTLNMPVDLKRLDHLANAAVDDISPGGVFIETNEDYDKGSHIDLQFKFPAQGPNADKEPITSIEVTGEIVWRGTKIRQHDRQVVTGIGVQFLDMDAETFEKIMALYERLDAEIC